MAAVGIGLGLILSLALARLVASLLYGVGAWDPATYAAISLLLGLVAVSAGFFPARRASATDPLKALRTE